MNTPKTRWLGVSKAPRTQPDRLDSAVLDILGRDLDQRDEQAFNSVLGFDYINCREVSYWHKDGLPVKLHLTLKIPADSTHIIETKSLKLYLNGAYYEQFDSTSHFVNRIKSELSEALGIAVEIKSNSPRHPDHAARKLESLGLNLPASIASPKATDAALKQHRETALTGLSQVEDENDRQGQTAMSRYTTDLFRSRCPVTYQPDWGRVTILVDRLVDPTNLLSYLLTFREAAMFQESCCDRIYSDLWKELIPKRLAVHLNFERRGGIDINPLRYVNMRGVAINTSL